MKIAGIVIIVIVVLDIIFRIIALIASRGDPRTEEQCPIYGGRCDVCCDMWTAHTFRKIMARRKTRRKITKKSNGIKY